MDSSRGMESLRLLKYQPSALYSFLFQVMICSPVMVWVGLSQKERVKSWGWSSTEVPRFKWAPWSSTAWVPSSTPSTKVSLLSSEAVTGCWRVEPSASVPSKDRSSTGSPKESVRGRAARENGAAMEASRDAAKQMDAIRFTIHLSLSYKLCKCLVSLQEMLASTYEKINTLHRDLIFSTFPTIQIIQHSHFKPFYGSFSGEPLECSKVLSFLSTHSPAFSRGFPPSFPQTAGRPQAYFRQICMIFY